MLLINGFEKGENTILCHITGIGDNSITMYTVGKM